MNDNDTMTIPNTTYNKFCWGLIRVWTGIWIASMVILLISLLASVANAQEDSSSTTIFSTLEGTYIINTFDLGEGATSSFLTGPGGSGSATTMDLGNGYSHTTINTVSPWGSDEDEDEIKTLLVIETYRQREEAREQEDIWHVHWIGCEHNE